jgi:hypothetical protein
MTAELLGWPFAAAFLLVVTWQVVAALAIHGHAAGR